MSDNSSIQVGDEVTWNWGGGHPTGEVKEMKSTGKLEIESTSGKRIHKNADEDNPAVHVERGGNGVVKRASELHRTRGGGAQDTAGETVVQEGEEPKKATRGSRKAKQSTGETRKKQSEGGKKGGGATTAAKKGGRKRGKAAMAAEEAVVGEKREREGVVEEQGEKTGEDVDMEKDRKEKVETTSVTAEQEKAEKEAGKEAKKARTLAEEAPQGESHVPGGASAPEEEEKEKERRQEEEKVAELTGSTITTAAEVRASGTSEELKELDRALGLDVEAGSAAGTGDVLEHTAETTSGAGEKHPSEKKRGGRKGAGARGKAH